NYKELLRKRMEEDLGPLFKNVTLFPFTTTDLTRKWIESIQPSFKMGLLFSKKKTKEEQDRRLGLLTADLQEKVKSQLLFHVQGFFQEVDRSKLSNSIEFEEAYDQLTYTVDGEFLKGLVKTGHSNRDYVFQFTKEVTSHIVKAIRLKAVKLLAMQIDGLEQYINQEKRLVALQFDELKEIDKFIQSIDSIKDGYNRKINLIKERRKALPSGDMYFHQLEKSTHLSYPQDKGKGFLHVTLPEESVIETDWTFGEKSAAPSFNEKEALTWLDNIKRVLKKKKDNEVLKKRK
ncbi:MAG: hypothetical protein LRY73_03295, partial [Bacillus sp. (in: Bacteria)]|nr:hypothetical protein [Bacillus sp. (in: firmicutes)]